MGVSGQFNFDDNRAQYQGPFGEAPAAQTSGGGWDGAGSSISYVPLAVGSPPFQWLLVAVASAVAGGVTAAIAFGTLPVLIVAWIVSGPVAFFLIALFTINDTKNRARSVYSSPSWIQPLYVAALVLAFAAVLLSAVGIAFWVGRA